MKVENSGIFLGWGRGGGGGDPSLAGVKTCWLLVIFWYFFGWEVGGGGGEARILLALKRVLLLDIFWYFFPKAHELILQNLDLTYVH